MSDPFQVLLFSSANLFGALSNERCDPDEVASQDRAQYLYRYLHDLGAEGIIVEYDYTDGDYLEDFASYYVRCYQEYDRRCKRLHFFSCPLTEDLLRNLITNALAPDEARILSDCYLGFIVARPLPSAIVGRTILKTYPSDAGRRHYTVIRTYTAHLFGTSLTVKSLPFQEQDSVLAACATVALWCAFHKTASLFGTTSPRPASITRTANRVAHRGRPVPSHGLRIEEMCHAVSDVGLEPELVDCLDKNVPLVSLAYGHLKMGIPVVLVAEIQDQGLHAITLTGYSLRDQRNLGREVPQRHTSIPMIGLRINEFYGHDDQVGPFSRLEVLPSTSVYPVLLKGAWKNRASGQPLELRPVAALIPIYNKVRVTFLDVQSWLTRLTEVLNVMVQDPANEIEWDVHLITTNRYKEQLKTSTIPRSTVERLLLNQQPRFMWRAVLRISGVQVLELLVDGTDMERSFPIIEGIWHHDGFRMAAQVILSAPAMQPSLEGVLTRRFLSFLKNIL